MGNIIIPPSFDTISKRLQYLAENFPDRELFVFYKEEVRDPYTCRELFQLAGRFAHRLRHQYGFQRGDILVNTLSNSPERLIADLGITLAGGVAMNGQILMADGSDFVLSARNSRCKAVILRHDDDFPAWKLLRSHVTGDEASEITSLAFDKAPDLTSAILVSRTATGQRKPFVEGLRSSDEEVFVDTTIVPDDLLLIFTTSGSTGYSKLVHRTHGNVITVAEIMQFPDTDFTSSGDATMYSDRLLGWPGGYPFQAYYSGQRRVLMDYFYSHGSKRGDIMWKAICNEKCETAVIFPLELDSILRYIASIGSAEYKIRTVATGAQPLKKPQMDGMLTISEQIFVGYGSTEQMVMSVGCVKSANVEDFFCGKPVANVQIRVVDENGKKCKPRQTGTLHVKGAVNFKGYFNRLQDPDPNSSKCFTKDGWFDTEDVGFFDEDDNIYVMGRNKDTIMFGTSVLYPAWLEANILQHPNIAEALVLPVSDPVLFHNICACVKRTVGSDLNEEKLKEYCESIFVADLENDLTPMPQFFMVFENFPETASGKPDKQELRRQAEERFGLVKPVSA